MCLKINHKWFISQGPVSLWNSLNISFTSGSHALSKVQLGRRDNQWDWIFVKGNFIFPIVCRVNNDGNRHVINVKMRFIGMDIMMMKLGCVAWSLTSTTPQHIYEVIQCALDISRSFFLKNSQNKPHSSSVRARYGVSFASAIMTSSNGNIFRVIGDLWGKFTGHRWIPRTKASDAELYFFYLRLNKRLSKQWWGWWFETPSRPLWRHCNAELDRSLPL